MFKYWWLYPKPKPKPKKRTVESEFRRLINERNFWRNRTRELRGGRRGR